MEPSDDKSENPWGESLPVKLLREGWTPYCFPGSTVIVALPPGVVGRFSEKGVLRGVARREGAFFTATLHSNSKFTQDRKSALEFVQNLAKKKGATAVDVATYRYFVDPTEARDDARVITFFVIGIPGAVVVVTLSRPTEGAASELVERVRQAIPQIVGEVV